MRYRIPIGDPEFRVADWTLANQLVELAAGTPAVFVEPPLGRHGNNTVVRVDEGGEPVVVGRLERGQGYDKTFVPMED